MKSPNLPGHVEKDKAPRGKGKGAVTAGEGLAPLGYSVGGASAIQLLHQESVGGDLAVRPAPVHKVRPKSERGSKVHVHQIPATKIESNNEGKMKLNKSR
jgi:hypothetical protein